MRIFLFLAMIPALTGIFSFKTKEKKRVIFFGDSITEMGSRSDGYITYLGQELDALKRKEEFELIGAGVSGNKIANLQARLNKDVLSKKPDIVVIYIGINDVWHFAHPNEGGGTSPENFENGLKDIIKKIQSNGSNVILCTPSVIGEKKNGLNFFDEELEIYSNISRKVAAETSTTVCDLRKAFTDYLQKNNKNDQEKNIFTYDGVHLNDFGNHFVAEELLKTLLSI